MLLAHVVPGYFAIQVAKAHWPPHWKSWQKGLLWAAAIGSTIAPDTDVIYNILWRGFANHSVLWTHSLFPHLSVAIVGLLMPRTQRWGLLRMALLLVATGGLSHLVLDVIVHGTPLFYPLNMVMVGRPPQQVTDGGLWGYLTHPIFLLEPLLLSTVVLHQFRQRG